ncbi:DUF6799 domain-containing protein [Flavobacterium sp.]|uniref:DUF6799 domain-containing protein n=1 Tax=Flavobacterium sp. TaxID=239 RepID=UPI00286CC356|nr:DUF6799 domain-containing protein [Flavobacterium sp.]
MKKALLTIAAIIITCGVFAQNDSENKKVNPEKTATQKQYPHPNGYMMKDGKLMMVKEGNMTLVQKDITLSNGTLIMADGNYMEKGKSKMILKEGEHIDMNGNKTPMKPKTK